MNDFAVVLVFAVGVGTRIRKGKHLSASHSSAWNGNGIQTIFCYYINCMPRGKISRRLQRGLYLTCYWGSCDCMVSLVPGLWATRSLGFGVDTRKTNLERLALLEPWGWHYWRNRLSRLPWCFLLLELGFAFVCVLCVCQVIQSCILFMTVIHISTLSVGIANGSVIVHVETWRPR